MWQESAGFARNAALFSLAGFGPVLWLWSGPRRLWASFLFAPVMGLILSTLAGGFLVATNHPITTWATAWWMVSVSASLLLTLLALRRGDTLANAETRRHLAGSLSAWLLLAILLLAPVHTGGLSFVILRGNGEDTLNYSTLAGYLESVPIRDGSRLEPQTLVEMNQTYGRARSALAGRWVTHMLLGLTSTTAGLDPIRFEYVSSLLWIWAAFGPALWLAVTLGLTVRVAALTALAVTTGFWGQLVLDIRALSQLNSIPLVLTIAAVAGQIERRRPESAPWREAVFLGLALGALVECYVEMIPTVSGSFAFAAVLLAFSGAASWRRIWIYSIAGATALLTIAPLAPTLAGFFLSQASYATAGKNQWHLAWFPFLFRDPVRALWGLACITPSERPILTPLVSYAAALGAGALTLVAAWGLVALARRRFRDVPVEALLVLGLLAAAGAQAVLMLSRQQWWAAGKAVTFGAPALVLCAAGLIVCVYSSPSWWHRLASALILVWLAAQASLGLLRVYVASTQKDFPNYIVHHGSYRRQDWNLDPIESALGQPPRTIWTAISDPYLSDYVALTLGRRHHVVPLGAMRDIEQLGMPRPSPGGRADFVLLDSSAGAASQPRARSGSLLLLDGQLSGATLLSVLNPNGIEKDPNGTLFFWLGGPAAVLSIYSSQPATTRLGALSQVGPSAPTSSLTLEVVTGGWTHRFPLRGDPVSVCLPLKQGDNEVRLRIVEPPARLLPQDPRPLLLRLTAPRLVPGACAVE